MSKLLPKVRGRSIAEIESIAESIVAKHSPETLDGKSCFPVLGYIDGPLKDEYEVDFGVEELGVGREGKLEDYTLILDKAVYVGLCNNQRRARFTGAHEIGHAVLHAGELAVMNDSARGRPSLYRKEDIKPYLNPEWQANTFAGALLMPAAGVRAVLKRKSWLGLSFAAAVMATRFCVSEQAAEIRLKKLIERGGVVL